jgi:hypothetical protein
MNGIIDGGGWRKKKPMKTMKLSQAFTGFLLDKEATGKSHYFSL